METSYTPLPAELRSILNSQGGEPLHLVDNETQKVYVLIEQSASMGLDDDAIRRLLAEADEDIANGRVAPLDMETIKAEARRIFEKRQSLREPR